MTPTAGGAPPRRPRWSWLLNLVLPLVAGLVGATWLTDLAGFPAPDTGPHLLLRVLCGLGIGLVTLSVVQFPDRTSPT